MSNPLKYHQAVFDLLKREPIFDASMPSRLDEQERKFNFRFPEAIREWYCLEDARTYLGGGQVAPIDALGDRTYFAYDGGIYPENLLPFLNENQGNWTYAVQLDGTDDPPVFVNPEDDHDWQFHVAHFSTLFYTFIWDIQARRLHAQTQPLSPDDLTFLETNFTAGPYTYACTGKTNYRFSDGNNRLLVKDRNIYTGRADWYFSQSSDSETIAFVKGVFEGCQTISRDREKSQLGNLPSYDRLLTAVLSSSEDLAHFARQDR